MLASRKKEQVARRNETAFDFQTVRLFAQIRWQPFGNLWYKQRNCMVGQVERSIIVVGSSKAGRYYSHRRQQTLLGHATVGSSNVGQSFWTTWSRTYFVDTVNLQINVIDGLFYMSPPQSMSSCSSSLSCSACSSSTSSSSSLCFDYCAAAASWRCWCLDLSCLLLWWPITKCRANCSKVRLCWGVVWP
jgi:hypothetical protein